MGTRINWPPVGQGRNLCRSLGSIFKATLPLGRISYPWLSTTFCPCLHDRFGFIVFRRDIGLQNSRNFDKAFLLFFYQRDLDLVSSTSARHWNYY